MPRPILHSTGGGIEGAWTKCGHLEGRPAYTCRDDFLLAHTDGLWRVYRRRVGDDGGRVVLATAVSLRAHPTTIAAGEWWDAAGQPTDLRFALAIYGSPDHPIDFEDMGDDYFELRRSKVVWYHDPAFGVQHSSRQKIKGKEGVAWCCICSRLVPSLRYRDEHGVRGHVADADALSFDDVCDLYALSACDATPS
jgi:hypothetical protein